VRRPFTTLVVTAWCTSAGTATGSTGESPAGGLITFYQRYVSDLRYGHCHFDPSCSHYAHTAIDRHGLFLGSALAADRLIRCHPGAWRYYERSASGALSDPVDRPNAPAGLRVPDWLLPLPRDDPFPAAMTAADPGRNARIREYADYGDLLASEGDCWRAESEYGRAAYLADTREARGWAARRIAACSYRAEDWPAAADGYLDAAGLAPDDVSRSRLTLMAAASLFNAADYEESAEVARRENGSEGEKAIFLLGLASMAEGRWEDAGSRFASLSESGDSPIRDRAVFLRWKADEGREVPRKRPAVAGTLSAVIPGSGQVYTGRLQDGLRHLVVDGILIWSVYRLFDSKSYGGGYLLAGFTLPFYVGNIVGAKRSAEQFNSAERVAYVSRVLDEAGRE